ncbi:MAG: cob(I)yrinic acid a,c-diamide adenosyltransferase [Armatimonadota bacterium]
MSNHGRVLLFTGDGKGKTTAALGMALRAAGHGMRVKIIQFIKSDSSTGEIAALQMLPGIEIIQTGCGFVPHASSSVFVDHRQAAEIGLEIATDAIESGEYSLVVMDEICCAVAKRLLDESDVIEAVRRAGSNTTVAMTGRGATAALKDLADTVTEMGCIKHGMQQGWSAQEGVEF